MVQGRKQAHVQGAEIRRPLRLGDRRQESGGGTPGAGGRRRAQGGGGARLQPEHDGDRLRRGRRGRIRLRRSRSLRRRRRRQQPHHQAPVRGVSRRLAVAEGSVAGANPRGRDPGFRLARRLARLPRHPAQAGETFGDAGDPLCDPVPHLLRRRRTRHPEPQRRRRVARDAQPPARRHARLGVAQRTHRPGRRRASSRQPAFHAAQGRPEHRRGDAGVAAATVFRGVRRAAAASSC